MKKKRKFSNGENDENIDEVQRDEETGRQKGDEEGERKEEVIVTCTALHFLL